MASIPSKPLLLVVCYVFLLGFASSSSEFSGISLPSSSPKVSLGFYYESLCPYCSSFIVNHLAKLFEDDLISVVDLHLSPWGNTKLRPDNVTVVCQVLFSLKFFNWFFSDSINWALILWCGRNQSDSPLTENILCCLHLRLDKLVFFFSFRIITVAIA